MLFFRLFSPKNLPFRSAKSGIPFSLKVKKIVAIGGTDAHTLVYHFGPFSKTIFPYRYHFKTINTHILVENKLSGDAETDSRQILAALKKGNAFIANDSVKSARGFRFYTAIGTKTCNMGEETHFKDGLILSAELPADAECVLLKDGKPLIRKQKCLNLYYSVESPGIYRIECYRRHLLEKRGWIFSNPIYIR